MKWREVVENIESIIRKIVQEEIDKIFGGKKFLDLDGVEVLVNQLDEKYKVKKSWKKKKRKLLKARKTIERLSK